jgi:hypothetical protein
MRIDNLDQHVDASYYSPARFDGLHYLQGIPAHPDCVLDLGCRNVATLQEVGKY